MVLLWIAAGLLFPLAAVLYLWIALRPKGPVWAQYASVACVMAAGIAGITACNDGGLPQTGLGDVLPTMFVGMISLSVLWCFWRIGP